MAVAVEDDPRPGHARARVELQRAVVDRLDEQLLDELRLARRPPRARGSPGCSARCSSRSVSRHDGSQPTIGTPRSAYGASRAVMSAAIPRAWSSRPLEMLARPQQPAALEPHAIAGRLEQLDRRAADRRLGERGERVGEEHDLAARSRRRAALSQRSSVSRAKRGSGRAAVDAGDALEQAARGAQVGQRRGRRAEPVEPPDRAEQPRAQRHAVDVLVVREELGLQRRHVDAQRALALARLALEAEVEDLVQPLVAQRGRAGPAATAP